MCIFAVKMSITPLVVHHPMRPLSRHRFAASLCPWLLAAVLVVYGCGCGGRRGDDAAPKPVSRGLPYELVVIVPRQAYEGELHDTLDAILRGSTPVLPQHEPLFRLNVTFTDANLTPWRTFRNRLIVKIDEQLREATLGVARDVVARPQTEVMVAGHDVHQLAVFLGRQRDVLTDLFVESELEWQAAQLRRKHNKESSEALRRLCGHTICVPPALRASKLGTDFLWTGTNLNDRDQNFVYYSYPWDGRPLTRSQYVRRRDSVMRVNIPGRDPGQWMQTAVSPVTGEPLVVIRARTLYNSRVLEVHGLWELRNGALGGAFVALERVDTARRRVIATEGFIYSPHSPKRNIMREMEAALRTFR